MAELEYELSCPVCLDLYKKPLTLPCTHSVCEKCFEEIKAKRGLDTVPCPICMKEVNTIEVRPKKNIVLERIISVYREDVATRLKRPQSLINHNGQKTVSETIDTERLKRIAKPLPSTSMLCSAIDDGNSSNRPIQPSSSVLDLQQELGSLQTGSQFFPKCSSLVCGSYANKAVILCSTCKNQYCRDCWSSWHPDLNTEGAHKHTLFVYVTAFHDEKGEIILCNVCDKALNKKAKLICFTCNVSMCTDCYQTQHPVLLIRHFVVTRPEVIPKPPQPCSHCTKQPPNIVDSSCKMCNKEFCRVCLPKISIHSCLKRLSIERSGVRGFTDEERLAQRSLLNVMELKKKIIEEIPKFFSKKCETGESKPDLVIGDRVIHFVEENPFTGIVQWIGEVPGNTDGIIFAGVEFDFEIGEDVKLPFQCQKGFGALLPILVLIKEEHYCPDTDNTETSPNEFDMEWQETQPTIGVDDRVGYIHRNQFVKGTVKWIGILPDDTSKQLKVGVAFDLPIGNGNGNYKGHRLFYAPDNYAEFINMDFLVKLGDLQDI